MDHESVEICNVDCKVEEKDPVSDPVEEKTAQPSLNIRESTQNRCDFCEQEIFTGNVASVTGEGIHCDTQICRKLGLFSSGTHKPMCESIIESVTCETVHMYIPSARGKQALLFPKCVVVKMHWA